MRGRLRAHLLQNAFQECPATISRTRALPAHRRGTGSLGSQSEPHPTRWPPRPPWVCHPLGSATLGK